MREKMPKKLANVLDARNARFFVALFALTLLISFVPVNVADAFGLGDLNPFSWGDKIVDGIASIIVTILTFVPALIFFGVAGLVNWMIDIVINIGIIPGAATEVPTPGFVNTGWEFTRGLVNALFILILVFIGLATMLRLQNYQMKRTLPSLLIVALLVNFSAVFVGFIVDMGNLVSIFFLSAMGEFGSDALGNIFTVGTDTINNLNFGQSIAYGFVMFIFYTVASFLFLSIFLLFLIRTVVLWTLVILAPLALASYILPATRGMVWNQWLKQLIQWSIIGIPLGFFLFLSNLVLRNPNLFGEQPNLVGAGIIGGILASVLSPIVGLLLLAIGVMFSLQFAPAGANKIIQWGAGKGVNSVKGISRATGTAIWRSAGQRLEGVGLRLRRGAEFAGLSNTRERERKQGKLQETIDQKIAERPALLKKMSNPHTPQEEDEARKALAENTKEVEGLEKQKKQLNPSRFYTTRGVGLATRGIAKWAGRGLELGASGITTRVKARDEKEIAEGKAEGTNKDARDNIRKVNQEFAKGGLANTNRVIGLLNAIVVNGDSDDLQEYIRNGIVDGTKIGDTIMKARNRGGPPAYRPLMKALGHRMLENPDQFGSNFVSVKENGETKRMTDGHTPVMQNNAAQGMISEFVEKLQQGEVANKILGDAIDAGKAGGAEWFDYGGKEMVELLIQHRGGDLAPGLIRRPESREGRAEILNLIKSINPENLHEWGADGLMTWMSSTAAQGAGVTAPLDQNRTRRLIDLLSQRDRNPSAFAGGKNDDGTRLVEELKELIDTWQAGAEKIAAAAGASSGGTGGRRSGGGPTTPPSSGASSGRPGPTTTRRTGGGPNTSSSQSSSPEDNDEPPRTTRRGGGPT